MSRDFNKIPAPRWNWMDSNNGLYLLAKNNNAVGYYCFSWLQIKRGIENPITTEQRDDILPTYGLSGMLIYNSDLKTFQGYRIYHHDTDDKINNKLRRIAQVWTTFYREIFDYNYIICMDIHELEKCLGM